MSLAETLLVLGTFGICIGVWVTMYWSWATLKVIIEQGKVDTAMSCECNPISMTITEKEIS